MFRHTRHPVTWFAALLVWFSVLWVLSSVHSVGPQVDVKHLDKLLHFGYFLGGGFLFAGWRFQLEPDNPAWSRILASAVITMALIGWIDEWHQCYTPGRSGADPWDWLADVLGSTAGALTFKSIHHYLK